MDGVQKERELIKKASHRIWRGTRRKGAFEKVRDSHVLKPQFHAVIVDLKKARNFRVGETPVENKANKAAVVGNAPSKSQKEESTTLHSGKEDRQNRQKNAGPSSVEVDNQQNGSQAKKVVQEGEPAKSKYSKISNVDPSGVLPIENGSRASIPQTSSDESGDVDKRRASDKNKDVNKKITHQKIESVPPNDSLHRGKKKQKLEGGALDKDLKRSPLTENGAAAVLKSLAQFTSPRVEPPKPKGHVLARSSWNSLEISEATRDLTKGDAVDAWSDPTANLPGGWVTCSVEDVKVLESGACAPYFAFLQLKFENLSLRHPNGGREFYQEWRPLAVRVPSSGAPQYKIQVRYCDAGARRNAVFEKNDRIEVLIDHLWCPGMLIESPEGNQYCSVALDTPPLSQPDGIVRQPLSKVRHAHPEEENWQGMLQEIQAHHD